MPVTQDEIKSMISELIELSKVDGHVSDQEIGFIQQVGNMLGLANEEILVLFKTPAPFNPPDQHFDRIVQFQRMVLLMNVDQNALDKEINYLKIMGMKLGLNPEAVDEVLEKMDDYPNNMIPPEDLLKIYSKHMN